eukprot:m.922494 g.922494  ORF g.922494 m.922494 type:complete len:163 (-) comp23759_c0_seq2:92-580(-)
MLPLRYATKNECFNFFTYADNDAIGYFRKQGFTKNITLPKSATHGYVKDYDGGTPMQCVLHKGVDYLNIPWMLHRQRDAILKVWVPECILLPCGVLCTVGRPCAYADVDAVLWKQCLRWFRVCSLLALLAWSIPLPTWCCRRHAGIDVDVCMDSNFCSIRSS